MRCWLLRCKAHSAARSQTRPLLRRQYYARVPTIAGPRFDCRRTTSGCGAFNIVEGLMDHHLLELHHVRDLPFHMPFHDWAFLFVAGSVSSASGQWRGRSRRGCAVAVTTSTARLDARHGAPPPETPHRFPYS